MDQLTRNINQSIRDAGLTPLSPAQDYVDHIAAGYRTRIESLQARVGDLCKSNQATALTLLKTIIQHELPFLTEALPGIDKIAAEALAEEEAAPATETETLKSRLCGRLFELMNINGKDDIDGSNELETVTRDTVSFEELESRPYLLTDGSRVNFYNKATWERLQGDGTLPETRKDIALPGVPLVAPQLNEILAMLRMRDLISAAPPTPPPAPNPIPILRRRKAATRTPSPMTKKVSLKLAWADSDPLTDRSPADSPSSLLRDLCKQRYESWLTHCMATVHPSWTPHVDGDAFDQMFAFLQVSTPSKSDFHRTWLARFVEVRLTAPTSSSPDTSSSTESPLKPAFVAPGSSKETLDKVIALFEGQGVPRAEVESVLAEFPVEELEPVLGTAQQCLVEFYDNRVSLEDCANRKDQEERHAAKVELNAQLGLPPPPEFVYDVSSPRSAPPPLLSDGRILQLFLAARFSPSSQPTPLAARRKGLHKGLTRWNAIRLAEYKRAQDGIARQQKLFEVQDV